MTDLRVLSFLTILFPVIFFLLTNKKRSFLYPPTGFTYLYIIKIVIPTITYCFVSNVYIANSTFLERSLSNDSVFLKYTILQSIGYCMVLLGMRFINTKNLPTYSNIIQNNEQISARYKTWAYVFLIIGIIGFYIVMSHVGGVLYFFSNLGLRTYLVKDLDFETRLLSFLQYAPIILIYSKKWTKDPIRLWDIVLIIICGLMVGLGGRKALIMLFIESAIIYHYVVSPINFKKVLNAKIIIVVCFVLFFFSTYSKLRVPGAYDEFMNDPIGFYFDKNEDGLASTLVSETYVPFYVSVVDYFDTHERWYGASFASLFTAFIPSSLFPEKPPVDDGMYLRSIALGVNARPPMPAKSLDGSSWPLETFGAMYANFGPLGVICGMFLLGIILSLWYKKMIKNNFKFKYLIFYVMLLFTFEISTLRIVQLIMSFVLLSFVQFIIEKKYD